jgi:hypothetical protein
LEYIADVAFEHHRGSSSLLQTLDQIYGGWFCGATA